MGRGANAATTEGLSFTRVREDVIEVLRTFGDLSLLCYRPSGNLPETVDPAEFTADEIARLKEMHGGADEQFFFATAAQLEKAARSKDPVTLLANHRKTRRYQHLHSQIPDIFDSGISFERLRRDHHTDFSEFFIEDGAALIEMEIDPARIVAFDGYDYTFWRPGEDHPANRLFGFDGTYGITGEKFSLPLAEAILKKHPWVRYVEMREGDWRSYRPSEVFFEAKFPEEIYMKLWQHAVADKRTVQSSLYKQPSLGVHAIYDMTIAPVKYLKPDENVDNEWLAQYSPLPFDPFGLREARVEHPERDEDDWED